MKLSKNGIDLIKGYEGLGLRSYRDSTGKWTVGYGHTATAKPDQKIEISEAEKLLKKDLERFENYVNKKINAKNLKLTQGQYDALVSFTYNLGSVADSLLDDIKNDPDNAIKRISLYRKATIKGKKQYLLGLHRRRISELVLFSGYPDEDINPKLLNTEELETLTSEIRQYVKENGIKDDEKNYEKRDRSNGETNLAITERSGNSANDT